MNDILTATIAAVIAAIGTISAAAIVEFIKQRRRSTGEVGSLVGSLLVTLVGLVVLFVIIGWLGVLLLRPTPSARILAPEDFDGATHVAAHTTILVEYNDVPGDHFIWVVVRDPKVRPMRLVYPQLSNGVPTPVQGTGRFEVTINLGGPNDALSPFNIEVLLLDAQANQTFLDYSAGCAGDGLCGGLKLQYPGAAILDFVTVVRE